MGDIIARALAAASLNRAQKDIVFVTPEMFGAKGDGIADDTQAIKSADVYANSKDFKLYGTQKYKITDQWVVKSRNVDFSEGKIILGNNFPKTEAVVLNIRSTSNIYRHNFTFDGNRTNQTLQVSALNVRGFAVPNFEIIVNALNCYNAVLVQGNSERGKITINAAETDRILMETTIVDPTTNDNTPDEMVYHINNGKNCKQFYYKETISSSMVYFNTEGSADESPYDYLVDISASGKPTQIFGLMRATKLKGVVVRNNANCYFRGLNIYHPLARAIDIQNGRVVSGTINIDFAVSDAVWVRNIQYASDLTINVCNFTGGIPVRIGDYDTGDTVRDSIVNVFVSASVADASNNFYDILKIDSANSSLINFNFTGSSNGKGIIMTDVSTYTLNLGNNIIQRNIPITTSSPTKTYDINFVGSPVGKSTLLAYTNKLKGMKATLFETGRPAYYNGSNWATPTDTILS